MTFLAAIKDPKRTAWLADETAFEYMISRLDYEAQLSEEKNSLVCEQKWKLVGDRFDINSYGFVFAPDFPEEARDFVNSNLEVFANDNNLYRWIHGCCSSPSTIPISDFAYMCIHTHTHTHTHCHLHHTNTRLCEFQSRGACQQGCTLSM